MLNIQNETINNLLNISFQSLQVIFRSSHILYNPGTMFRDGLKIGTNLSLGDIRLSLMFTTALYGPRFESGWYDEESCGSWRISVKAEEIFNKNHDYKYTNKPFDSQFVLFCLILPITFSTIS